MARLALCAGCMHHFPVVDLKRGRCPSCLKSQQRAKDQRRGTASQRGYGKAWRELRAQLIAAHPYCSNPDCREPITKDNPLSVDHIVQRQHGGSDDPSNLRVLCLSCNHSRPHNNAPQPRPRFSRNTLREGARVASKPEGAGTTSPASRGINSHAGTRRKE